LIFLHVNLITKELNAGQIIIFISLLQFKNK